METIPEKVFQLRQRIALLEGQVAGANAELVKLKDIPCPNCNGAGYFTREENNLTYQEDCKVCGRSGKAAGQKVGW